MFVLKSLHLPWLWGFLEAPMQRINHFLFTIQFIIQLVLWKRFLQCTFFYYYYFFSFLLINTIYPSHMKRHVIYAKYKISLIAPSPIFLLYFFRGRGGRFQKSNAMKLPMIMKIECEFVNYCLCDFSRTGISAQ